MSQPKMHPALAFTLAWIAGIVIGQTYLLAPIHELGHWAVAMAEGRSTPSIQWAWMNSGGYDTFAIVVAGYLVEGIFWPAAALFAASRGHMKTALALLAYTVSTVFHARVSNDLADLELLIGQDAAQSVWLGWAVVMLPMLFLAHLAAVALYQHRLAVEARSSRKVSRMYA